MKPADIGLPQKFDAWYGYQEDAIAFAVCADTRFVALNAPTGVGKSVIHMGIASILGGRALAVTGTKLLQSQLEDDFASMGLKSIWGQNNYPCLYFEGDGQSRKRLPGCDDGPCHAGIECGLRDQGCTYYDEVRRAGRASLVNTNYSYLMYANRYADPTRSIGKFDTLILDEAHAAAEQLSEFVRIHLVYEEIERLLGLQVPGGRDIAEWVEWAAREALPLCRARIEQSRSQANLDRHWVLTVRRLRGMETNLDDLASAYNWQRTDAPNPSVWVPGTSTDWIVEESSDQVTFSPVWASGYAERYLFNHIPKVVLLSATITPRDCSYLGIAESDLTFKSFPSPFNRRIRPIIVLPCAKVSRNMSAGEERIWINKIDAIIEYEGNVKGIIHSVSYPRADLIKSRSRFKDRMIIPEYHRGIGRDVRGAVARFKRADAPAILVAPSVETGYDFPYELARYQIIAKVPFIDHRSELMKARHKADKRYLDHAAMVRLIQMAGRGVRAADDYCRTYIIDDNWRNWFYPRNRDMIPKWFNSAIIRVRSLDDVKRKLS